MILTHSYADLSEAITDRVGRLYERYPYPHYPVFVPLRWQEGYFSSALFSARLVQNLTGKAHPLYHCKRPHVYVGGCGEALPYIMRHWEPRRHRITAVDLASANLRRAKMRLMTSTKTVHFICGDVTRHLEGSSPESVDHCDFYGVLHHLADPMRTTAAIGRALKEGGTLRAMVYNTPARSWIQTISKVFSLLELNPYVACELSEARKFLQVWGEADPALERKLTMMGKSLLSNPARFVDTFFHPRVTAFSLEKWLSIFESAGLKSVSLYDRYGELDHLRSPLHEFPALEDLAALSETGEFENNYELILQKAGPVVKNLQKHKQSASLQRLRYRAPPISWFTFRETEDLSRYVRWRLWYAFLSHLEGKSTPYNLAHLIPTPAMKRLSRLGALLPGMLADKTLERVCRAPMEHRHDEDIQQLSQPSREPAEVLEARIDRLLVRNKCYSEGRKKAVMLRISSLNRVL